MLSGDMADFMDSYVNTNFIISLSSGADRGLQIARARKIICAQHTSGLQFCGVHG